MCGILGVVERFAIAGSPVKPSPSPVTTGERVDVAGGLRFSIEPPQGNAISQPVWSKMLDDLAERGPDGQGWGYGAGVVFGHRRLAIRDPQAGRQPWVSADGRRLLVYNGELYNDAQLRKELVRRGHRFRTQCDTETVLAAYEEWGLDCVTRLDGMFALGLYDRSLERLLLARDSVGVKPLFYTINETRIAFASTMAPLLRLAGVSGKMCWPVVSHYLATLRTTLGSRTLLSDVRTLQPGELLIAERGAVRVCGFTAERLSRPEPPLARDPHSLTASSLRLEGVLQRAVEKRLISDVPVGMFLSGGVDSNTLACLTRSAMGQRFPGFCVQGLDGDGRLSEDVTHARQLAEHLQLELTTVSVTPGTYLHRWSWMVERLGQPLTTPNDVLIYEVSKVARKSVGVVLGGEGADELFGGYGAAQWAGRDYALAQHLGQHSSQMTSQQRRLCAHTLLRHYGRLQFASPVDHYFAANSLIPHHVQAGLFSATGANQVIDQTEVHRVYQPLLQDCVEDSKTTAAAVDWAYGGRIDSGRDAGVRAFGRVLQAVNLPSLLLRLDQSSMLAGLEARVPYTDGEVIDLVNTLPLAQLTRIVPHETAVSMAAADLQQRGSLETKRVLRRLASRHLPQTLSQRPKQSFPTPFARWLQADFGQQLGQQLAKSSWAREYLASDVLSQLSDQPAMAGMWLWPLANLAIWGDRVVCGEKVASPVAA